MVGQVSSWPVALVGVESTGQLSSCSARREQCCSGQRPQGAGLWVQTDMPQDPVDDEGLIEEGHDPAFAKAVWAEQHVHLEGALVILRLSQ